MIDDETSGAADQPGGLRLCPLIAFDETLEANTSSGSCGSSSRARGATASCAGRS